MSFAGVAARAIKDVLLYREAIDRLRREFGAMSGDVKALAMAHAALSKRVARLEGVIQGVALASARRSPRRLPARTDPGS